MMRKTITLGMYEMQTSKDFPACKVREEGLSEGEKRSILLEKEEEYS